jgi:hypothetical protein
VADSQGNLGVVLNLGGNPGFFVFGAGALAGAQGSVSTADTIYDLKGWSFGAGGSAGPFGVDVSASGGGVTGTVTAGVGVGTRGSALSINHTSLLTSTNCLKN